MGEILGKIEIAKTKHLVAFLMSKMDSTQNFSPENGITCHISESGKFLKFVPKVSPSFLNPVIYHYIICIYYICYIMYIMLYMYIYICIYIT